MLYRYFLLIIMLISLSFNVLHATNILNENGNLLEIYGSVNPNHMLSHFFSSKLRSNKNNSMYIIGLFGKTQINDLFSSYFHIEYTPDLFLFENKDHKNNINHLSLGYAGLKYGNFGSIDYGRNYGIIHDAHSLVTDAPFFLSNSLLKKGAEYMIQQNNSLLTYRNKNIFNVIDGITFSLQYQDSHATTRKEQEIGPGWGGSIKYENDSGVALVGSFFTSNTIRMVLNENFHSAVKRLYGLGAKYNTDRLYLGGFYSVAHHITPYKNLKDDLLNHYLDITNDLEIVIEYSIDDTLYSSISYIDTVGKNIHFIDHQLNQTYLPLTQHINLSTCYKTSHNFSTYVNYKINFLKNNFFLYNNNLGVDNILSSGIVYQF